MTIFEAALFLVGAAAIPCLLIGLPQEIQRRRKRKAEEEAR